MYAKWLKELKTCFPCVYRAMETDFRKVTADFFSSLQKETDFHFKKMPFATILMNPGKEPFLHLYLKFTTFVLTKQSSHDDRMIIRSLKSHQPVDGMIRANITSLLQSQSEVALVKTRLLSVIAEYRKNFIQCSRERNEEQRAAESVAAEWQSVFAELDNSEDTCGAYMKQILELRNKLPLQADDLLTQLESDLSICKRRASLLHACSDIDVISRMRCWELVGKKVASEIRKGEKGFVFTKI